jgi:hypothetical protein
MISMYSGPILPHYAKIAVDQLQQGNINRLQKKRIAHQDDPANCPEARPIVDFWSLFMREGDELQTTQLVTRISYGLKQRDDVVQRLSESTHRRTDVIEVRYFFC